MAIGLTTVQLRCGPGAFGKQCPAERRVSGSRTLVLGLRVATFCATALLAVIGGGTGSAFASAGCTSVNGGAFNITTTGTFGNPAENTRSASGFAAGDKLAFTLTVPDSNRPAWELGDPTILVSNLSLPQGVTTLNYTVTGNGDTNLTQTTAAGNGGDVSSVTVVATCTPPQSNTVSNASQNLNLLEIAATKFAASASGAAITSALDGAIGDAFGNGGTPVTAGPNGITFNFAAEPQPNARTQEAFDAISYAATGYNKAPPPPQLFDRVWNAWADVRGTGFDQHDAAGSDHGSQLNVTAGIGRKLTPDFLVGVFGGYENFLFTMASIQGRMTGEGETIGGYTAWRFADHWRVDGKFGWTDVSYNGTAGNTAVGAAPATASGSFTGSRWLAAGGFTGTYLLAAWTVEPSARIYSLWERDTAFTDSLGTAQPSRNFSESRVSTGAKAMYPWLSGPDLKLSPYAGVYGDFRFSTDSALPVGAPFVGLKDGWSARVTSGLALTLRNNATISLGGEVGGIGAGYEIWSVNAKVKWPF